jgi:tetratricopeptide (TPR) repeat protein
MKITLVALILFSFLSISTTGQSSYETLLQEGSDCLESRGDNCISFFKKAVTESKKQKNDSITADVYLKGHIGFQKAGVPFDQIWSWLDEADAFLKNKKNYGQKALILIAKGNSILNYSQEGDYLSYYDSALTNALKTDNYSAIVQAYISKARGLKEKGLYHEGIEELTKALHFAKKSDDVLLVSRVKLGLGNAYYANNDMDLSLKMLKEAADITLAEKDTFHYWYIMTNWSNVSVSNHEIREAIPVLKDAVNYFLDKNHSNISPFPMSQLGRAYKDIGEFKLAISILRRSEKLCNEYGIGAQEAYNQMNLADCYYSISNLDSALFYSSKAYNFYKEKDIALEFTEIAKIHTKVLEQKGKFKEALLVANELAVKKDSIYNADKIKEIGILQSRLELEEKEAQLCAQESEIAILASDKREANLRNMALAFGLLFLAVIAFLVVKRKDAANKLKEAKNRELKIKLDYQKRELTSKALQIAEQNDFLTSLQEELEDARKSGRSIEMREIASKLQYEKQVNDSWENFMITFTESSPEFIKSLTEKHPDLTQNELHICALAKMGLSIKETASLFHITTDAVKKARYRLRKKLDLETENSLESYIQKLT